MRNAVHDLSAFRLYWNSPVAGVCGHSPVRPAPVPELSGRHPSPPLLLVTLTGPRTSPPSAPLYGWESVAFWWSSRCMSTLWRRKDRNTYLVPTAFIRYMAMDVSCCQQILTSSPCITETWWDMVFFDA